MTAEVTFELQDKNGQSGYLIPPHAFVPTQVPGEGHLFVYDAASSAVKKIAVKIIGIRTLEERVHLAQQNVAIQQESLCIATVRFEKGAVTELDVQQARSLLGNTQALVPQLKILLRQAENALSILLGMPPHDLSPILAGAVGLPTPPAEVAIGIPAELLRRRPDIKQAEMQAAAQSAQIGIAEADLYPSFTLFGSIGLSAASTGSSDLSDLFNGESLGFSVGPAVRWNLFNYGRLKNLVRLEDARLEQLLINYQNVVLQAALEVEDAQVGFIRSKEQAQFLDESVAAAKRAAELAMIQYREGTVDYQRVLDTDRFLTEQQDTLAQGVCPQTDQDQDAAKNRLGEFARNRGSCSACRRGTAELVARSRLVRFDGSGVLTVRTLASGMLQLTTC